MFVVSTEGFVLKGLVGMKKDHGCKACIRRVTAMMESAVHDDDK